MNASSRIKWELILTSIFILYLIFSPSINILHYSGDDFKYSFGGIAKSCAKNDGYHFMLTIGRPLQAFIDCIGFKFAYTLEGMKWVRIVTVITMGFFMGMLAEWLIIIGLSLSISFFVAGSLVLIAHLYVDAIPMAAISLPAALLFALLGYRWINHTPYSLKWSAASFIAVLASLLTYPALTFFFITLMLIKILFSPLKNIVKTRQEIIRELMVFVLANIVYFVWAYYNIHYHVRTEIPPAYQVGHPNINPVEMIRRLLLLANVYTSWWPLSPLSDMTLQGNIMIVLIIFGGVSSFTVACKKIYQGRQSLAATGEASLIALSLLVLSSGFLLIMPNLDVMENRVLYGAITSGMILVFWGAWQLKQILPASLGILAMVMALGSLFLMQGYQASMVTMINGLSHVEYLHDTTKIISDYLATGKPLKQIHFVIPRDNSPYDRFPLAQAAILPIMKDAPFKLRWCAWLPTGSKPHQEAENCLKKIKNNEIAVTYNFEDEPVSKHSNMIKIQNHFTSITIL